VRVAIWTIGKENLRLSEIPDRVALFQRNERETVSLMR